MSLFVTPAQLSFRAELYHQLGSLISAGVPIIQALEQMHRNPPARSFREPIGRLIVTLQGGSNFTQAMALSGHWMPAFDLALLDAGEKTGRLDSSFKLLAIYYRERARLVRQVISNLIYPVILLHMAVLLFPINLFTDLVLQAKFAPFFLAKGMVLLPLYGVVVMLLWLSQGERGLPVRLVMEKAGGLIPILGKARRDLSLARLSAALEALINAGVSIYEAWELAAQASGSPAFERRVLSWRDRRDQNLTPSELLASSPEFPELFSNQYHTGEISGSQDQTLRRMHHYFQDEGTRRLQAFADWFPRVIYFIIVILVALQVLKFWTSYFGQINQLL